VIAMLMDAVSSSDASMNIWVYEYTSIRVYE
jgi:hypothetical protein